MHGGPLTVNKVDFNQYILLSDADNKQFDDLWQLISEKGKALFYIKGQAGCCRGNWHSPQNSSVSYDYRSPLPSAY